LEREDIGVADSLVVTDRVEIPLAEIELRASRSSGPGGQHANVTASRVEAVFDVTASEALTEDEKRRIADRLGDRVTAVAQDARGQARNRELALERLREKLAVALKPPKPRRATKPSKAAKERRLDAKRRTSQRKRQRRPPDPGEG
jgi:ribosome-associated protein